MVKFERNSVIVQFDGQVAVQYASRNEFVSAINTSQGKVHY
jgi:hypothetical protein